MRYMVYFLNAKNKDSHASCCFCLPLPSNCMLCYCSLYRPSTTLAKLVGSTRRGMRTRRAEVLQSLGASTTESDVNDLASDSTRAPDNSEDCHVHFIDFVFNFNYYCSGTMLQYD